MGNFFSNHPKYNEDDGTRKADFWMDMGLSAIFLVILGFHTYLTLKSFKSVEMKNIYNYLMTSSIFACLVIHIGCF